MGILENKIALVTGASRGIGKAIARELASAGATVIGTATSAAGVEVINQELGLINATSYGVLLDVNQPDACDVVFDTLIKDHAGLHILVNNAGVTRDQLALRMKDDDWSTVINTNLSAVFRLSRLALRPMMKAREGRIINITSVIGSIGNPGQANYAAAKAGVAGMSRALASEVGSRNITVNCIAPGFVESDMTAALSSEQQAALIGKIPLGRMGKAEEIAHAVVFLSSPQAAYITGTTLHINGGMYMG